METLGNYLPGMFYISSYFGNNLKLNTKGKISEEKQNRTMKAVEKYLIV